MLRPLLTRLSRLAGLSLLLLPALARAQCPVMVGCTPSKASSTLASAYGMGIYNVTLGSINNSTAGYTDGYQDYSCVATGVGRTTLPVSTPAAISIRSGTVTAENVRVWVDYNNNGAFSSDELAFSSDNKLLHTGTITPPATAALGVPLRLRVASDYANGAVPTACSTPEYSQDEDYSLTLTANTRPPVVAFTQNATTTCTGAVQFTDQSTNGPTSWLWRFGDNTTSSLPNPLHTYAATGTYQVTLTATNAAGSSTSAATPITYTTVVPVAACSGLAATANCCGYGITRVRLADLDNTSADGSAGYQDFTCAQRATLTAGGAYTLSIGTGGTRTHDVRAWLDLNNDGTFSATEKLGEALAATSPSLSFTLPASATLGQPLRLRLVADGSGTNPQPCTAPTLGQVEDYTVTVVPNTSPPTVAFTSTYVAGACSTPANTYTFTDQSTNDPTAWQWSFSPSAGVSFVNGTSASSRSPQVAFATAGLYAVTLRATNANGSSTTTVPNYLLVQVPCLAYCAANGGTATATSSLWITNVGVSPGTSGGTAFGNASGNAVGGYAFFGNQAVGLTGGTTQAISVTTNLSTTHRISIWVDYNRDGVFANTTGAGGELAYNGLTNTATTTLAAAIPNSPGSTRLRVVVTQNNNTPNPCLTNQGEAEVEDYLVTIAAAPLAARSEQALPALTVSPNPTPDGYLRLQVSEASAAGLYRAAVTNILGASLLSQSLRLGTAPATLDLRALPAGLYLLRLTDAQGQTAVRRVVRQ